MRALCAGIMPKVSERRVTGGRREGLQPFARSDESATTVAEMTTTLVMVVVKLFWSRF